MLDAILGTWILVAFVAWILLTLIDGIGTVQRIFDKRAERQSSVDVTMQQMYAKELHVHPDREFLGTEALRRHHTTKGDNGG